MNVRSFYIFIFIIIFSNIYQFAYSNPSFRNARNLELIEIQEKIKIDGQIEDKAWQKLKYAENFTVYPIRNKPKFDTKFKLAYDTNSLYLLVHLESFKITNEPIPKNVSNVNYFEFYIMPDLNNKKFIQISIGDNGQINKKLIDGVSLTESEININIEFKYETTNDGKTNFEIKLNLEDLGFAQGKIAPFLFNLTRVIQPPQEIIEIKNEKGESFPEKKYKTILKGEKEVSAWSPIGYQNNNFYTFGKINLANNELKRSDVDLANYLNYAESFINSVDIYYKAINNFTELVPEGTEITHDASLGETDHIPVAQYPCKIDGYYRLYLKTSIKDYQNLAHQIIDKTYKVYQLTKDYNGNNWIPFCNLVDTKGKSHGYDQGPKSTRYFPGRVKFDQSKAPFEVKLNYFGDNFGFGLLQLSYLQDKIDENYRKKLIELMAGLINFYSQDHILNSADSNYFWQTITFNPLDKPNTKIEKPKMYLLGQDIVYIHLAAINFDAPNKSEYIKNMKQFFDFYLLERNNLPARTFENSCWLDRPLWRIEYLDIRAIKLLEALLPFDKSWVEDKKEKLVQILSKSYAVHPKIKYSEEGLTTNSDSTLLTLCVYNFLKDANLKEKADNFLYYNFSYNGLYMGKNFNIELNTSTYSIVQYMAFHLWKNNQELGYLVPETLMNIATILNRKEELMNNKKWCGLEIKEHKKLRGWRAVPDRCYVENTQAEGIYKDNEKQAYLKIWGCDNPEKATKYFDPIDIFYRFAFYQFTAPFQVHAEPFPFGESMTFNMIKTNVTNKSDAVIEVSGEIDQNLPLGTPIFGAVDITDLVYLNKSLYTPTDLYPAEIKCDDYNFIFNQTFVAEYDRPKSRIDNSKIVFVSNFNGKTKFNISIKFNKINKRKLVDLNSNE